MRAELVAPHIEIEEDERELRPHRRRAPRGGLRHHRGQRPAPRPPQLAPRAPPSPPSASKRWSTSSRPSLHEGGHHRVPPQREGASACAPSPTGRASSTWRPRGERRVTAGDIQATADYEIVNPDLHLATLDSTERAPDRRVQRRAGPRLRARRRAARRLPIGVIPVDAIFTPVRKVNYQVERTRVGQVTNYDRLVLEVWTDGTITGVEAVSQSADPSSLSSSASSASSASPSRRWSSEAWGSGAALSPDRYNTPIEELSLSVRAYNCLKRSGLMTVGQVLEKSEDELLALRNFGRKSYDELKSKLIQMGFLQPESRRRKRWAGPSRRKRKKRMNL